MSIRQLHTSRPLCAPNLSKQPEPLTVQAIAEQTGYNDIKHFRKLFKASTGMTPHAYRGLYQ